MTGQVFSQTKFFLIFLASFLVRRRREIWLVFLLFGWFIFEVVVNIEEFFG